MVITEESTARHVPQAPGVLVEAYSLQGLPAEVKPKNNLHLLQKPRWLDSHSHTQLLLSWMSVEAARRCSHIFANSTLVDRVKAFEPDAVLSDLFITCSAVWGHLLQKPVVVIHNGPIIEDMLSSWNPFNPSSFHIPAPLFTNTVSGVEGNHRPMTLTRAVRNIGQYIKMHLLQYFFVDKAVADLMRQHAVDLRPGSKARSAMVLLNSDFSFEEARHLPPNVHMVGPLMMDEPKPLPADLEEFMQGSENGVIAVATGTIFHLDKERLVRLGRALSRLPVRVLWKLSTADVADQAAIDELGLRPNIKVVRWLPQNDVLAHNKTIGFVSHCGINSVLEALWHGVPIVGSPGLGDQPDNADRVAGLGAGVALPLLLDLKEEELYRGVMQLLSDPSYHENARRVSIRLRSHARSGVQRAADWIEVAAVTGGADHLRPLEEQGALLYKKGMNIAVIVTVFVVIPGLLLNRGWSLGFFKAFSSQRGALMP
eukprot:jgi/Botrbrau1/6046/Bobra.0042s0029.1